MFAERIYELYVGWENARGQNLEFDLKALATPEEAAQVEQLIAALNPARPDPSNASPELPPNTARYRFEAFVARGGMGEVYRGHDLELDRAVALKVLRRFGSGSVRTFRVEAKLAARLTHPGIVPVHDFGILPDGRPFFAMKLVDGRTLEEIIRNAVDRDTDLPRWLQYFEQICQAVAYSHAQDPPLLHRDLKPQNVMIGAFGEVLVMDWGLAREASQDSDERPESSLPQGSPRSGDPTTDDDVADRTPNATRTGVAKGTWAYMAPEQARGEHQNIGPECDVFGLGGILCRMLTGAPTYVGEDAMKRAQSGDLDDAFQRLDRSGADPELAAIAKKCLMPDRRDRFRHAGETAEAVAAYRNGIEARLRRAEIDRAAAEAQAREQRKRRRVMQWAGGAIAGVLSAGIIGTAVGMVRARESARQEKFAHDAELSAKLAETKAKDEALIAAANEKEARIRADRERMLSETIRDVIKNRLLRQASPFENTRGGAAKDDPRSGPRQELTVREALDRAATELGPDNIHKAFPDQPLVQAEILETIGETYEGIQEFDRAIRFVEAAHAIRVKQFGADHPAVLASQVSLVFIHLAGSRLVESVKLMHAVADRLETLLREVPESAEARDGHAALVRIDAILQRFQDRANADLFSYARIDPQAPKPVELAFQVPLLMGKVNRLASECERRFGPDDVRTMAIELWLAFGQQAMGQSRAAMARYEKLIAKAEKSLGPDSRFLEGVRETLLVTYEFLGLKEFERLKQYKILYESKLARNGPYHPSTLVTQSNLGRSYRLTGQTADAIRVLEDLQQKLGPQHEKAAICQHELARSYAASGRHPEAIKLFSQVLNVIVAKFGPNHLYSLSVSADLAMSHGNNGDLAQAVKIYENIHSVMASDKAAKDPRLQFVTVQLAFGYQQLGDHKKALPLFQQLAEASRAKNGADHSETLNWLTLYAKASQRAGQPRESIAQLSPSAEKILAAKTPPTVDKLELLTALAAAHRDVREYDKAIRYLKASRDGSVALHGPAEDSTLYVEHELGVAYAEAGTPELGVPHLKKVAEPSKDRKTPFPPGPPWIVESAANRLADFYQSRGDIAESARYRGLVPKKK